MLPSLNRLDDPTDLTAVLDRGVADSEVLERELVPQRDRLFGTCLQRRVVREVSPNALGARFKIDNRNANVVRGVMDKKVNHQLLLLAQSIRRDCRWRCVLSREMLQALRFRVPGPTRSA